MWLAGWKYRRKITINNSLAYGLSDYQVWIPTSAFGSQWAAIRSSAQPTMADFRFTPSTATTTIPYWIDPDTTTANCSGFWVKISTLPVGVSTIYMYYGNASTGAFSNFDIMVYSSDVTSVSYTHFVSWTQATPPATNSPTGHYISDDSAATFSWHSSPATMPDYGGIDFGSGNVKKITKLRLQGHSNPLANFELQGSNDSTTGLNGTWTTLKSGTFLSRTDYVWEEWTFSNSTDYRWYRIKIISQYATGWAMFEWELMGFHRASSPPTITSVAAEEGAFFSTGTYRSAVIDTTSKVVVSSVSWNPSSQPAGTNIAVGIRVSSYPFSINSSTPAWLTVSNGQILNWHGRYIQYISTFTTSVTTSTPRLEDMTITYRVKPWQEKIVTRTPPNSLGFGGGEVWTWEVPVKSGSALTITAYIRYNSEYGGSTTKPKLTLSGKGISPTSVSATSSAENAWELLTINAGTPSQNATLTLRAEGFSAIPNAKFYIDDVNISQ